MRLAVTLILAAKPICQVKTENQWESFGGTRVLWAAASAPSSHPYAWSKLGMDSNALTYTPTYVEGSHPLLCKQAAPPSSQLYLIPHGMRMKPVQGPGAVGSSGWCRVLGRGESHAAASPAVTALSFFSLVNLAVSTSQADLKRASLPCLKVPAKHLALKDRI